MDYWRGIFSILFLKKILHIFVTFRFIYFCKYIISCLGYNGNISIQRKRNNFDYREILLSEYKRKGSPEASSEKFKKPRPRMRTDIVPRVPLSIVRAYFELVGVVKQIFGMVFLFRARDSRPPSLRRKKCYYWEVSRRKRNRVRRTRLNEGTFFALPNPIKISPV